MIGYLFVAPAFVGFLIFYLLPTVRAVGISLTDWNLMRAPKFVGLGNYATLLSDGNFWHSAKVTLAYVLYNIPLQTVLGLLLAVLSDRLARAVWLRATIIAPYLISNVVAALVWMMMLDPILGLVNAFLTFFGVSPQGFLASPDQAMVSVAAISTWRHTGLTALLFYAGLQAIPGYLYEAARLEGAGEWTMFRRITLPLLRPVLAFVVVTSLIGSFQVFDVVAVATAGGPSNSTRVILWYIYENAFKFNRMGYASAISVVLFATLILVTLLQMRVLRADQSDLD
ncbi:sugar ABC transporter permease [Mesorhizobium sp. 1M-11]|uniref:carbohydrate ABC transporter permease n=1 Tax=Mesorhizobium sp. 1M-11 TaxID=1529006 RepID=UPI001FCD8BE4|nr:sugar ABC transporter permease [Mesorhizobium sp. 1M-11]